jgi:type I restriction enzyme S subunit
VRTTSLASPVRLEWLLEQNARLDARPYVGGAFEARDLLNRLTVPIQPLRELTTGYGGGLYDGPRFRRGWVTEREHGVPFLGSADMLEADLSHLPLLRRADAESPQLSFLRVEAGMTFISRSGTVGRVVYARPDMAGCWSSEDTIKVVANRERILPGYLYAVLASRLGTAILVNSRSGTGIRHLEPAQVADIALRCSGRGSHPRARRGGDGAARRVPAPARRGHRGPVHQRRVAGAGRPAVAHPAP